MFPSVSVKTFYLACISVFFSFVVAARAEDHRPEDSMRYHFDPTRGGHYVADPENLKNQKFEQLILYSINKMLQTLCASPDKEGASALAAKLMWVARFIENKEVHFDETYKNQLIDFTSSGGSYINPNQHHFTLGKDFEKRLFNDPDSPDLMLESMLHIYDLGHLPPNLYNPYKKPEYQSGVSLIARTKLEGYASEIDAAILSVENQRNASLAKEGFVDESSLPKLTAESKNKLEKALRELLAYVKREAPSSDKDSAGYSLTNAAIRDQAFQLETISRSLETTLPHIALYQEASPEIAKLYRALIDLQAPVLKLAEERWVQARRSGNTGTDKDKSGWSREDFDKNKTNGTLPACVSTLLTSNHNQALASDLDQLSDKKLSARVLNRLRALGTDDSLKLRIPFTDPLLSASLYKSRSGRQLQDAISESPDGTYDLLTPGRLHYQLTQTTGNQEPPITELSAKVLKEVQGHLPLIFEDFADILGFTSPQFPDPSSREQITRWLNEWRLGNMDDPSWEKAILALAQKLPPNSIRKILDSEDALGFRSMSNFEPETKVRFAAFQEIVANLARHHSPEEALALTKTSFGKQIETKLEDFTSREIHQIPLAPFQTGAFRQATGSAVPVEPASGMASFFPGAAHLQKNTYAWGDSLALQAALLEKRGSLGSLAALTALNSPPKTNVGRSLGLPIDSDTPNRDSLEKQLTGLITSTRSVPGEPNEWWKRVGKILADSGNELFNFKGGDPRKFSTDTDGSLSLPKKIETEPTALGEKISFALKLGLATKGLPAEMKAEISNRLGIFYNDNPENPDGAWLKNAGQLVQIFPEARFKALLGSSAYHFGVKDFEGRKRLLEQLYFASSERGRGVEGAGENGALGEPSHYHFTYQEMEKGIGAAKDPPAVVKNWLADQLRTTSPLISILKVRPEEMIEWQQRGQKPEDLTVSLLKHFNPAQLKIVREAALKELDRSSTTQLPSSERTATLKSLEIIADTIGKVLNPTNSPLSKMYDFELARANQMARSQADLVQANHGAKAVAKPPPGWQALKARQEATDRAASQLFEVAAKSSQEKQLANSLLSFAYYDKSRGEYFLPFELNSSMRSKNVPTKIALRLGDGQDLSKVISELKFFTEKMKQKVGGVDISGLQTYHIAEFDKFKSPEGDTLGAIPMMFQP